MNEEFLIRLGADSRAMVAGFQRAGAYVKAWATTVIDDFTSRFGRMFASAFLVTKAIQFGQQTFTNIQNKILSIRRMQEALPGASSNWLQGIENHLERIGLSYADAEKPLIKFKRTLDLAKANPAGKEFESLQRYGIVVDAADLRTQKFSESVAKLAAAYQKFGKSLAVVNDTAGKPSPALIALLSMDPEKLRAMEKFNFFSDISQASINLFTGAFGTQKTVGQVLTATVANIFEKFTPSILTSGSGMTRIPLTQWGFFKLLLERKGEEENKQAAINAQMAETLQMEEERVSVNAKLLVLEERRRELSAQINDQGKTTVAQMAEEARRALGIRPPRLYGTTARQRIAMNIDNLERRAQIAWESGRDKLHDQLWAQAQQMRAANTWLVDKDQHPMLQTENQLKIVNMQLGPIKDMAEFVNKQHGGGAGGVW